MIRRHALIVLGGATCSAAAAELLRPRMKLADQLGPIDLAHSIPERFGSWTSIGSDTVAIINPEIERVIRQKYNELLNRSYVNAAGYRLMVSVAYGGNQTDAVSVHRPEGCYPAQGFVIERVWMTDLQTPYGSMPITRVMTRFGTSRPEPVSYWVVIGNQLLRYQGEKKIVDLKYAVRNLIPDGVVFRVSSIDPDAEAALGQHDSFVRQLLPSLPLDKRPRLMGV
jgi:EpsI family protein